MSEFKLVHNYPTLPSMGDAPSSIHMLKMEDAINTGFRGGLTVIKSSPFLCAEFFFFLVVFLFILFY